MRALATGAVAALALAVGLATPAGAHDGEDHGFVHAGASDVSRFTLAGGCFGLRSRANGFVVERSPGGGYRASAASAGDGEGFRFKATGPGRYLLLGDGGRFLAVDTLGQVRPSEDPGAASEWRVEGTRGSYSLAFQPDGRMLAVGSGGDLVLGGGGDATRFSFEGTTGCATFPEAELNVRGKPSHIPSSIAETRGLLESHLHWMAFEFLGGSAHCGRPWSPFGITKALVDCPDHSGNGTGAVLENLISTGSPAGTHDTSGWSAFRGWPRHDSLTHEQTYHRWIERSWRSGLRLMQMLLVENEVLCIVYPLKRNSCNEMDSARLQLRDIHALQDYVDAQHGGPGRGWFRVVRDPFEARRVINQGKLAVLIGIEVSTLFDCEIQNDVPRCTTEQIDRQLEEFHRAGVRDLQLVNKFDNGLAGVTMDGGAQGPPVNAANRYKTGEFWEVETCTGPAHDKTQINSVPGDGRDELVAAIFKAFGPTGQVPVYPPPPHCNVKGLTSLGEHLIRRMIEKGMIVDIDHLSVRARDQALDLLERERYSGVFSSHSWADEPSYPRIYRLGGVISPSDGRSDDFVDEWRLIRRYRDPRHYFGFGFGSDLGGFSSAPRPRTEGGNPVTYPFRSLDGKQVIDRQRSGERVYDVNSDGVAHYGLFPDWVEDLRKLGGPAIAEELQRGPEAYLQMWERATGIAPIACRSRFDPFTALGLGRVRLGASPEDVLRRAGQPSRRVVRVYRWCVNGEPRASTRVAFTLARRVGFIVSTARHSTAFGVGPGALASRVRGARRFGPGLLVRNAGRGTTVVFGVSRGRVRFVAVAGPGVVRDLWVLRGYLRLAGVA